METYSRGFYFLAATILIKDVIKQYHCGKRSGALINDFANKSIQERKYIDFMIRNILEFTLVRVFGILSFDLTREERKYGFAIRREVQQVYKRDNFL